MDRFIALFIAAWMSTSPAVAAKVNKGFSNELCLTEKQHILQLFNPLILTLMDIYWIERFDSICDPIGNKYRDLA